MINLFDHYNQLSWDLHFSLISSGYKNPTIVLNDDGFLPNDVTSPYLFYLGYDVEDYSPLYYNQVAVPDYWEIIGTNTDAFVYDLAEKKAHISYSNPSHRRFVKEVDWLDHNGNVLVKDCYNKSGYRFAQKSYNKESKLVQTTYFNAIGQSVIVENHTTGDILLTQEDKEFVFKQKVDFVSHYLRDAQFDLSAIFYNSLATPFLVSYYLAKPGKDVLFWNEPIRQTIPGNMMALLEQKSRPTKIIFQDWQAFQKAQQLLSPQYKNQIDFLGFMYPNKRQNQLTANAFVLTNSDQIEGLEQIIRELPELNIAIGAITEMSPKLMALAQYQNVTLYPNIATPKVEELYQDCDIYLDINQFNEILTAVRTAFEHNQVILAFKSTAHQPKFTAKEHIVEDGHIADMIKQLKLLIKDEQAFRNAVEMQRFKDISSLPQDYQEKVGAFYDA
ncbi:accessory Sec system glycosyltransferase GTFB [Streptococcus urinalis FB127-CNA-2]|uniref:UDP-N-acetylglucosamine--peptide N-acetylglucosaminyltransferase stabilizing protein GtfB n=1 Tax=Streptococcus urinalis 2285-97 TaxID=764291 RepID=G5KI14_9STRE|nr:accessory Sec system glycosylation chaperone GtfB [Streptococcus urinalis]EHJ57601.1 accessory Sec system glycosyltransferase GtfB [Streptococcus urinalis 2285-97]EKS20502.1 accessory Sec system glycosyltransferase GTFB [Streptococcus urinalis FB127-CNA-2]VEF31195.1 accessory Sec system glycosyltransferase GtfB [Streptococcus urinalis]